MKFLEKFSELRADIKAERADFTPEVAGTVAPATDLKSLGTVLKAWMGSFPPEKLSPGLNMRVSKVAQMCPREVVLQYWSPQIGVQFDALSQLRVSMGTHLHQFFQEQVLGPLGLLYGGWHIEGTEDVTVGHHPCKGFFCWEDRKIRFSEPEFFSPALQLSGHIDGFIRKDRLEYCMAHVKECSRSPRDFSKVLHHLEETSDQMLIGEIKTVSSFVFSKLDSANDIADYYKSQASLYCYFSGCEETAFIFLDRDSLAFKVLTYRMEMRWVNEALRRIYIVLNSIKDRTIPESMMACRMPTDVRAKKCPHKDSCWPLLTKTGGDSKFIEKCIAEQPDRVWLDLSDWKEPTNPKETATWRMNHLKPCSETSEED